MKSVTFSADGSAATVAQPPAPEAQTWALSDIYPTRAAFIEARTGFEKRLPELDGIRGTLGESAAALARGLRAVSDASKELSRLMSYASMGADGDTRDGELQALRQECQVLVTDFSRRISFVRPEILAMEPATLLAYLDDEPDLAEHRHFLQDLLRTRKHVLEPGEERILAEAGLITGGPNSLFSLMQNAEMPRPTVKLQNGDEIELTPSLFSKHRTTSVREDRRNMFDRYFSSYESFKATLGQNLYESVKGHVFRARARHYDSCLHAALDGENIPTQVYRNLIEQVHANLPVLHRYFALRGRALGIDEMGYHDLYCPLLSDNPMRFEIDEASRLVRDSMRPLGDEYGSALARAFDRRWIDWHPRPGKRSGAYATGAAYDVHPFVLMNFNGDYEGVTTLTHEMGHAMHSYFSNSSQPYPSASYSIFVAEVASTFNEALLNAHMLEHATDDRARMFLLSSYLDGLRATLFRQTMFAEFELDIHERAERGEALTGDRLNDLYLGLLRRYHGHDAGTVRIDDRFAVEWAAIPHFYYNFYVYQYSTGIVAATALAAAVQADKPGARARYLEFLRSGGSDYSLQLLRGAGVDLEQPEPYAATFEAMSHKLDLLEELLDRNA